MLKVEWKDVEQAFSMLQPWWTIILGHVRFFGIGKIEKYNVHMYNMIIEDERDIIANRDDDEVEAPIVVVQGCT